MSGIDGAAVSDIDPSSAAADAPTGLFATLSDKAYSQLAEMIISLELRPGSLVSEPMLSQRLGIGRTPIREAFQRLIREGLVVAFPHRGLMIAEINQRTQLRLLEVRRELDRLLARLCAERANAQDRAKFSGIAAAMRASAAAGDDEEFMRLDRAFNRLMNQSADNEFAAKSVELVQGLWTRFWNRFYRDVGDIPRVAQLHAGIAEAIARQDPVAAAEASDRLVDYIGEFTRATLDC
jgi:DNA-binding GntR family transcriptional regulator